MRIKRLHIVYVKHLFVCGFQFFDYQNELMYEIGETRSDTKETVELEDNEVIIGVSAKLDYCH